MSLTTRVGLLAGASALTLTGVSFADNPAGAQEDYAARIAELEARVAQLQGDDWLTEERAEEVRSLVQDVLADADTRASLLQSGMTAGYDDGFMIGSSDGNFLLKINGQLQTRFVYNNQDDGRVAMPNTDDQHRSGFENARTKLMFSGHVGSPEWKYYIEGDFARNGGDFTLDDAWIAYDMGNGWQVMMGQTKVPLNREFLVHSSKQLTVERSVTSYIYGGGRTQGILLDYRGDQFHFTSGITDGANGANSPWSRYDTEYSQTHRLEMLLAGNWEQFEDFTSPQGSEQGMMVGIGFHHQSQEYGTSTTDNELQIWIISADFSWELDGATLFGSFSYADLDNDTNSANPAHIDSNPYGIVLQGGLYFNEKWEGFVRYEYNDYDDFDFSTGMSRMNLDDGSLITVGVNGYYSDNVKMTADIGYAFDPIITPADITGARTDMGNEDGQFILRTQLQLTF